jgi:DNA polymerase-3 subunit epsilon
MVDPQQIFFKLEQRTLSAAYKFYCGKNLEGAHCAENDICATIEVLEAQLARYTNDLKSDVNELHNFCSGGDVFVDYHRVMKMQDGYPCFTLGKHKGKRVADVFNAEPGYYDWMMKGNFGQHTKQKISEILLEERGLKAKKKGIKV